MTAPDTFVDLSLFSDEELNEVCSTVKTEIERRDRLRDIPAMIAGIAARFVEDGGDISEIRGALPQEE